MKPFPVLRMQIIPQRPWENRSSSKGIRDVIGTFYIPICILLVIVIGFEVEMLARINSGANEDASIVRRFQVLCHPT